MSGLQYFSLDLACGHVYETSAMREDQEGNPYNPDYVGQEMPARCCEDVDQHIVTAQKRIPQPTGIRT